MKRMLLSAALTLTLTGAATFAQVPQQAAPDQQAPAPVVRQHHHEHGPQHEVQRLAKMLNLTPDQTAKLEPILASRDQQMHAIHANGQLTQQDARQQMRSVHQSTEQQLAGVLTPDQLQQMKAMHHHGPHGGPHQGMQSAPGV